MKIHYDLNSYKAIRAFVAYLRSNDMDFTVKSGVRCMTTVTTHIEAKQMADTEHGYQQAIKAK